MSRYNLDTLKIAPGKTLQDLLDAGFTQYYLPCAHFDGKVSTFLSLIIDVEVMDFSKVDVCILDNTTCQPHLYLQSFFQGIDKPAPNDAVAEAVGDVERHITNLIKKGIIEVQPNE